MSETDPSNEQNTRLDANTRVDSAHGTLGGDIPLSPDPPLDLLKAIAGQDAEQAETQLRGQALELAGILQEKQRILDERESEINAKTAQLETELRHGRLAHRQKTPLDAGIDLSSNEPDSPEVEDATCDRVGDLQLETVRRWRDMLKLQEADDRSTPLELPTAEPMPTLEPEATQAKLEPPPAEVVDHQPLYAEVEAPPMEIGTTTTDIGRPEFEIIEIEPIDIEPILVDPVEVVPVEIEPVASVELPEETMEPEPVVAAEETPEAATAAQPNVFRMPPAEEPSERDRRQFEQQRQVLLQRKEKLDSRQQHVERMHEQVTSLHREALELQLSTEQLWSELMENFPSEELARRLSLTRNRLAEHFRITSENLAHRTDELHQLRQELNEQDSKLRQKRRELQMWADRRYDEIEMRTVELTCRERELDRLEMEFDRQSIQWQQQRQAYRQEIERLSTQLQGSQLQVHSP